MPIKKEPLLLILLFFQQVHVLAQFCFIQAPYVAELQWTFQLAQFALLSVLVQAFPPPPHFPQVFAQF